MGKDRYPLAEAEGAEWVEGAESAESAEDEEGVAAVVVAAAAAAEGGSEPHCWLFRFQSWFWFAYRQARV